MNALGYLRVMFTVNDIDETLTRLRGAWRAARRRVVQYEESYRLCYTAAPKGFVGLAEELGKGVPAWVQLPCGRPAPD